MAFRTLLGAVNVVPPLGNVVFKRPSSMLRRREPPVEHHDRSAPRSASDRRLRLIARRSGRTLLDDARLVHARQAWRQAHLGSGDGRYRLCLLVRAPVRARAASASHRHSPRRYRYPGGDGDGLSDAGHSRAAENDHFRSVATDRRLGFARQTMHYLIVRQSIEIQHRQSGTAD